MGSKDNEGIGIPSCNLPNEKDKPTDKPRSGLSVGLFTCWAALSLSPPRLDEQKTGLVGKLRPVHTIVRMGKQTLFPKSGFDERALLGDTGQECRGKHAPGFGKREQVGRCQLLH